MFDVAKSLLRYWETEFKEIQPRKDRGGTRRYTAKDIEKIDRIYDLVKIRGFTIEGARKEIERSNALPKERKALKSSLESLLISLKKIRNRL